MTPKELREFSHRNWMQIPAERRLDCLFSLDEFIPDEVLDEWKTNWDQKGIYPGEETPGFHLLGGGMHIRNRLRAIIPDDGLPSVLYDGEEMRNWDDFYMGALQDLIERHGAKDG